MTRKLKFPCAPLKPSTMMKYTRPATTERVKREPWRSLPEPSATTQPIVSSLHPTSCPVSQRSRRAYRTVSNVVPLPQVSNVAVPEICGVQANTCSGDELLVAQLPLEVLTPAVVPVKTPPSAGMVVTREHASPTAVPLGTGMTVAVAVAVRVALGVAVRVGERVDVAGGGSVGVAVRTALGVVVAVEVRVGVASGGGVALISGVAVASGNAVRVAVAERVAVGLATVAVGVRLGDRVALGFVSGVGVLALGATTRNENRPCAVLYPSTTMK